MSQRPKLSSPQRRRELLHRRVGDRVVVLDTETNLAMALEPSVAAVWTALEGTADPEVVAEQTGLTPEEVEGSLVALSAAGLLEPLDSSERSMISRRAVLGVGAGASAALISSVLLPTPAMASSGAGETTNTNGPVAGASAASGSAASAGSLTTTATTAGAPGSRTSSPQPHSSGGLAFTGLDSRDDIVVAAGLIAAGVTVVAANTRGSAKRSLSQGDPQA